MPKNPDNEIGSTAPGLSLSEKAKAGPTRREAIRAIGAGALAASLGGAPAAAQMAQGHREVRPGTPPLAGVRVIERSNLMSGRLAGLLLADQGAEVFVERAGPTPAADQHTALDDGYFDRGKITLPPGAAADAASADIVIVDGAAEFTRAPHQILLRIVAALPGDEAYGNLPHDCSEDLINAIGGFFTNMSVSGPILNRPVIYTPIPLPSVYCGVNSAVAAVAALVDRLRTGLGREIVGQPHRRRVVGDRCAQHHLQRAARLSRADCGRRPAAGDDARTVSHLRRRRAPRPGTADVAGTALRALFDAIPHEGQSMDPANGRAKRPALPTSARSHGAMGSSPRHRRGLREPLRSRQHRRYAAQPGR